MQAPAISAEWTRYQPNAQGSLWLADMNITRGDDGKGSFESGIRLDSCFVGSVSNVFMVGDEAHQSGVGIDLIDCAALRFYACDVNRYGIGISGRAIESPQQEGITFTACNAYDCDSGFEFDRALELRLIGCHSNINGANAADALRLWRVRQSFITGCLIYAGGLDGNPPGQNGIEMRECIGVHVVNNQIISVAPQRTLVGVRSLGYNTQNVITGNTISSFRAGMAFGKTDTFNDTAPNHFFGCDKAMENV